MRRFKVLLITGFFIFAAHSLFAEAIFLNDGSIIEGKIISETDDLLTVQEGRRTREIPRTDVLRILYTDDYKEKRYIYTLDGREIEGYIVAEDRNTYTMRKRLESRDETTVMKSDVDAVTRRPIGRLVLEDKKPAAERARIKFSLGLYYQGVLDMKIEDDESGEKIDLEQSYIGLAFDIVFSELLGFRGTLLYDIADPDDFTGAERTGWGFTGTLCFTIHSAENMDRPATWILRNE